MKNFTFQFLMCLYKAKKIISRVVRKIDDEINRYADILNINKGLRKACKFSGAILLFLFITDIHRYGAWYTGNAVFYKYEWFVFIIIVLWVPFIIVVLFLLFEFLARKDSIILDIIVAILISYIIWFLILSYYLLPDEDDWLNWGRGYLSVRDADETFWAVIILPLFFTILFSFRTFYDWVVSPQELITRKTGDKAIKNAKGEVNYCPSCLNKTQPMLKFTSSEGTEKFWCDDCGFILD